MTPTDPNYIWGANPYPGRVVIRQLWMAESWVDAKAILVGRRDELQDAYAQSMGFVCPDTTAEERRNWAQSRYVRRCAEVAQKFAEPNPCSSSGCSTTGGTE